MLLPAVGPKCRSKTSRWVHAWSCIVGLKIDNLATMFVFDSKKFKATTTSCILTPAIDKQVIKKPNLREVESVFLEFLGSQVEQLAKTKTNDNNISIVTAYKNNS